MSTPYGAEPILVSVKEAVRLSAHSRSRIYQLIKAGRLTVVKNGSRTLLPMADLKRLAQGSPSP